MKNILLIDGADNCAYDIFQVTQSEFKVLFPEDGQDIAFIEDLVKAKNAGDVDLTFMTEIWKRPIHKSKVNGIHGTLFYQLEFKKEYYPSRKDSDLDKFGKAFKTTDLL